MPVALNKRKQQEREARDNLILSVASDLFAINGYHHTTMQAIANEVGYSKGTIYQHYTCKEDVLAKLYLNCGLILLDSMSAITESNFSIRMKIMMIASVFLNNAKDLPAISSNVTLVKSPEFFSKLSLDHQQEITAIDGQMLVKIISLFDDFSDFDCEKIKNATFGWWSMQLGVQSILISGWDISALGFQSPEYSMFLSLNIFLDGLDIPPCDECKSWEYVRQQSQVILT
jgi:AcrR family transcriptional regulator